MRSSRPRLECNIDDVSPRGDEELLEAWRGGDQDAGSALFERHFDSLYRFFRNKAHGPVEDLVQDTFLACVGRRDALRGDASFRTYLFTVARHELYAHWRKHARRADDVDIGEISLADLATSPSGLIARRAEHKLLLQALRAIPLDLQIALELTYWENMDGPELAEILGIPEGTVRSRLRRARELLEARMSELAEDPGVLQSTTTDLDGWARSLAAEVHGKVARAR
jgi:RNA polymerase sigma-70 factor (ECF subfamily)